MTTTRDESQGMLAAGRRVEIVERLRRDGTVRVRDLAQDLNVSDVTIRRDIDMLAELGAVEKVHGGAQFRGSLSRDEPAFDTKRARQIDEKRAIAREAAKEIGPGMVIAVSAGSTTFSLAPELRRTADLTIITNSLPVAAQFELSGAESRFGPTVLLTGGEQTPSNALVGPIAVAAVRALHVDLLFLGVHGMDERAGFTTPNLRESEVNQALIESAKRIVVLADHTKWGVVGLSTMAPLAAADVLVSDSGLSAEGRALASEHVGRLVIASA